MMKNKARREAWKSFLIFFPIGLVGFALCAWGIGLFFENSSGDTQALIECLIPMFIFLMIMIGSVASLFGSQRAKAVTTGEITAVVSPEEENPGRTASGRPSRLHTCHFTYTVDNREYSGSETVTAPKDNPERVYDYMHTEINVYYDPKRPDKNWPVMPPLDAIVPRTERSGPVEPETERESLPEGMQVPDGYSFVKQIVSEVYSYEGMEYDINQASVIRDPDGLYYIRHYRNCCYCGADGKPETNIRDKCDQIADPSDVNRSNYMDWTIRVRLGREFVLLQRKGEKPDEGARKWAEANDNRTGLTMRPINNYYGSTNPGIYTGDDERKLLLYSLEEMNIGHPHHEFDFIVYMYGTYYLHHLFGDKTAAGDDYYPVPMDLLDENNSISFGDLAIYCEKCESFVMKLTSDYCRSVAQTESARHGISEDDIRYWRKDDRIAFLHPYEKTEYLIGLGGREVMFKSMTDQTKFYIPREQYDRDLGGSVIPEKLYRNQIQQASSGDR